MKFRFSLKYFLLTIFIFLVEVLIATVFRRIVFVRSFLGDVIVEWLLYTFVLAFFQVKSKVKLISGIFVFSVMIEVLQYFKTADFLGLKPGSIPYIMLGNSFSRADILCYFSGCLILFLMVKIYRPKLS